MIRLVRIHLQRYTPLFISPRVRIIAIEGYRVCQTLQKYAYAVNIAMNTSLPGISRKMVLMIRERELHSPW